MDDSALLTWQSAIIICILGGAICTLIFLLSDMLQKPSFLRRTHQKKTFSVCQDDVFSKEERQNLKFMRYLIEIGRISDHIQ